MNKPSMRAMRATAQAGFTLIELIVVIVILGILAATALPKFASLGSDARIASLRAAQGALAATSAMMHGQALLRPGVTSFTNEGSPVTTVNGYPAGIGTTATAAGLTAADYTIKTAAAPASGAALDTANHIPAIPVNGFVVIPNSVAGSAVAETCFISYAEATATTTPPVISAAPTPASCGQ